MSIDNYGAGLPKKYKSNSKGYIEKLGIKKLFRGIILGPSNAGKTNLVFHILKNSPHVFSHLHLICRNPDQEIYNYIRDTLGPEFCTTYDPLEKPPSVDDIKKDPKGGIQ